MIENIHIYAYADPDQLRRCLDSIPNGMDVRVFDGRYCHFDGETDTTPAFREICDPYPNVELYVPPDEALPFGDPNLPPEWRSDVHEKTRWVWSHLPADEWTMKLDTDETVERLPSDLDLQDDLKYCPTLFSDEDTRSRVNTTRIWKPIHWTFWINDCFLPRELFGRDADLDKLAKIWTDDTYRMLRFANRVMLDDIEIRNYGKDRPEDYQRRRIDHLELIGRDDRAADVREFVE